MKDDLFDIMTVWVGDLLRMNIECVHCSNINRNYPITDIPFHCYFCKKKYRLDISKTKEYRDIVYRNPYSHLFKKGSYSSVIALSGPETSIAMLQDLKEVLVQKWGWQVLTPKEWKKINLGKYADYVQQQGNPSEDIKKPVLMHLPDGRKMYLFVLQLRGKVEVALERD